MVQNVKKLVRKLLPVFLLKAVEKGYRKGRGSILQARYGFPARGMRVIAVTGTNGKSTTAAYINEMLKTTGYKTAVLNTVFYEIAGKRTPNDTHFTVDKQSIVQSFFARAKKADVDFVILEVTSHALDQDRIMGVPVEIAVITNLTQDHLDYHDTMENYAKAKSRLMRNYGAKYVVLNRDDEWYGYFEDRAIGEVFSFGKDKSSTARISNVKLLKHESQAELKTENEKLNISTRMIGEFNIYNAAAAASVGLILGISPSKIASGIGKLTEMKGRMQEIKEGQNFRVMVDFAITPDAIEKALQSLRKITKGKVRIVFGATGDRDKQKRPEMGKAAAENADYIYLTDDETYTENPEKIRNAVLNGIKKTGGEKKTKVIADREEAIKQAFKDAKSGDAVLITGLGHEDSRNMGGKLVPWRDQDVASRLLKKAS